MAGVRGSLRLPLGRDGSLHLRDPQLKAATLSSDDRARRRTSSRRGPRRTRASSWTTGPRPRDGGGSSRRASRRGARRRRGSSRTRLPCCRRSRAGAAELLLLACSRDVRWLLDDDRIVGVELFGTQAPDSLIVPLVTNIDAKDVRLLNKVREALSKSCRDPDGAPGAAVQPLVDLLDRATGSRSRGLDSFAEAQLLPGVDEEVLLAPLSRVGMAALEVEEDNGKRERDDDEVVEEEPRRPRTPRARLADY